MRPFFIFLLATCFLTITSCNQRILSSSQPKKTVAFGFLKVVRYQKPVTGGLELTFSNGNSVKTDSEGLFSALVPAGHSSIVKVTTLDTGVEYKIENLILRCGDKGSKTYIGHLTLAIASTENGEKWNWTVQSRWKEAWQAWIKKSGVDRDRFYVNMAEKRGPDKIQTRAIATDRQAVDTGF